MQVIWQQGKINTIFISVSVVNVPGNVSITFFPHYKLDGEHASNK